MANTYQKLISLVLLFLLCVTSAVAQTQVLENQVRPPAVAAPAFRMIFPDGTIRYVVLGPGLAVNSSTVPYQIEATVTAPQPSLSIQTFGLTSSGNNTWTWSVPNVQGTGLFVLSRNGLVQRPGLDYNVSGNSVVFTSIQGSDPADVITGVFAVSSGSQAAVNVERPVVAMGDVGGPDRSKVGTVVGPRQYDNRASIWNPGALDASARSTPEGLAAAVQSARR